MKENVMSDSLRDALEKLAREKISEWYGAEWNASDDTFYETEDGGATGSRDDDAMLELRGVRLALDLLAKHPAEPVGVSDEAVEAGVAAWATAGAVASVQIRAALEAARPFMQPQVVASPKRVAEVLKTELLRQQADEWFDVPGLARYLRESLLAAGVFREPPTREQIEQALRKRLVDSNFNGHLHEPVRTQTIDQWVDVLAGAVLALMGGAK